MDLLFHTELQSTSEQYFLSYVSPIYEWLNSQWGNVLNDKTYRESLCVCVSRLGTTQGVCEGERERELCLILLSAMVGQIGARQAKERDPKQHLPQTDHSMGLGGEPRKEEWYTYGSESSIEKKADVTDKAP